MRAMANLAIQRRSAGGMVAARRIVRLAVAASVGACLVAGLLTPLASEASSPRAVRAAAGGGIPALVNPAADLAAQVPGPEPTWVDSIFIAGFVRGGGHTFGVLVHALAFPNADQRKLYVAVTDTTTGWYRNYAAEIPKDKFAWSTAELRIRAPGLSWTGSARHMQVTATTPWGALKASFTPVGPVMNYSGNGLIRLLGDVNYEYAFPTMRTVGTLTTGRTTRRIAGVSWLDRQWGPIPVVDPSMRWTWMNLSLSSGDQLAVWDIRNRSAGSAWVTALRPDGSYAIAAVRPLALGAGAFWTSPVTRKTYPMRWRIDIPALRSRLQVAVTGPKGQEFPNGHVEATASVRGTHQGRTVTGTTFVEMTGDWTRPR